MIGDNVINDLGNLKDFDVYVNKLVEKKIYEILDSLGVESSDYAIVDSVSTDENNNVLSAVVKTSTDNKVEVVNKSGETISVGDTVKIYGSRKNISNRYIGIKCGGTEEGDTNNENT